MFQKIQTSKKKIPWSKLYLKQLFNQISSTFLYCSFVQADKIVCTNTLNSSVCSMKLEAYLGWYFNCSLNLDGFLTTAILFSLPHTGFTLKPIIWKWKLGHFCVISFGFAHAGDFQYPNQPVGLWHSLRLLCPALYVNSSAFFLCNQWFLKSGKATKNIAVVFQ